MFARSKVLASYKNGIYSSVRCLKGLLAHWVSLVLGLISLLPSVWVHTLTPPRTDPRSFSVPLPGAVLAAYFLLVEPSLERSRCDSPPVQQPSLWNVPEAESLVYVYISLERIRRTSGLFNLESDLTRSLQHFAWVDEATASSPSPALAASPAAFDAERGTGRGTVLAGAALIVGAYIRGRERPPRWRGDSGGRLAEVLRCVVEIGVETGWHTASERLSSRLGIRESGLRNLRTAKNANGGDGEPGARDEGQMADEDGGDGRQGAVGLQESYGRGRHRAIPLQLSTQAHGRALEYDSRVVESEVTRPGRCVVSESSLREASLTEGLEARNAAAAADRVPPSNQTRA
ncbi:hypothetical protein DFH09DRAFT_1085876 [Mycena vulgaris]|nr:hypothetical protein DFH09DRAFT_1085876 [Mycena vulgaris]